MKPAISVEPLLAALALAGGLALAQPAPAADEPAPPQQVADAQVEPPAVEAGAPDAPKRPGFVRRKLHAVFNDEDDDGTGRGLHWGPFAPRIDVSSAGSGLAPTMHFWLPDIGSSPVSFHASASYSLLKYAYIDAQFGLIPHKGQHLPPNEKSTTAVFPLADIEKTAEIPGFNVYVSGRYRDFPRESFYGIGPESTRDARTDYRRRDGLYEGLVRWRVSRVSIMGRVGILQTSILTGEDPNFPDLVPDDSVPGILRSPDFLHASLGAWFEGRDLPDNAHRGVSLGAAYSRFDDRNGDAYQFDRVAAEAREYLSLGTPRHVVALREAGVWDQADEGSRVPFYLQPMLGGGQFLRGFDTARFRDDNCVAFTAEYRFELRPKIELAAIYDAGEVYSAQNAFDFGRLEHSVGAGLRLKSPRKVRFRLDVMHSNEATRVIVRFKPSF